MADAKEAWSEVGHRFGGLGETLKEHFTHPPSKADDADAAPADLVDSEVAAGDTSAATDAEALKDAGAADALKKAFHTLGEALDGAVEAVGAAAKDPKIADEVRQVGQALVNALSTTFTDAGDEVRKAFNRGRPAEGDAAGDTTVVDSTVVETEEPRESGE